MMDTVAIFMFHNPFPFYQILDISYRSSLSFNHVLWLAGEAMCISRQIFLSEPKIMDSKDLQNLSFLKYLADS